MKCYGAFMPYNAKLQRRQDWGGCVVCRGQIENYNDLFLV